MAETELAPLKAQLAELLLLEHMARKCWGARPAPYFRRTGEQFAAVLAASRAEYLATVADDLSNPAKPGSMNSMPAQGRSGGLPAVFDGDEDGALVVEDEEVVILD